MTLHAEAVGIDWRSETETLVRRIAPRGKSLIMTVFGDAVLPHGGGTWLGDLIALLEPLGLSQRMIRTSVYRLVQDGLLSARQSGRRSFYSLTPDGTRQSLEASRRIYALRPQSWDGTWTQVWLPETDGSGRREGLALDLARLGFASPSPAAMLHLGSALEGARDSAARAGLADETVIMTSRVESGHRAASTFVRRLWPLEELAFEYARFLDSAETIAAGLKTPSRPDPARCFELRTLLIHAYRRIVLKDPFLPRDLLPGHWPGLLATDRMREIHEAIALPAQRHVMQALGDLDGPYGPPDAVFAERFTAPAPPRP